MESRSSCNAIWGSYATLLPGIIAETQTAGFGEHSGALNASVMHMQWRR